MKIEILFFEGCPNHGGAKKRAKEVLNEECLGAEFVEVNVQDGVVALTLRKASARGSLRGN